MNDWEETLRWYDTHQTTREIGFNPDGMCLKVCRVARDIGAVYPSAKVAQDATPGKYRVHKVRDLRRGMVGYFDDPNDSNAFGHIATMVGRVKGFDWDDLGDTLWETNSVKSGELVVVRGSYFEQYWGDKFQFGATWLNGVELDVYTKLTRVQQFKRSGPDYNVRLLDRAIREGGRVDLKPRRDQIDQLVSRLSDDGRRTRIARFKTHYTKHRVLKMRQLDRVVSDSPDDHKTRTIRNALRLAIKAMPER